MKAEFPTILACSVSPPVLESLLSICGYLPNKDREQRLPSRYRYQGNASRRESVARSRQRRGPASVRATTFNGFNGYQGSIPVAYCALPPISGDCSPCAFSIASNLSSHPCGGAHFPAAGLPGRRERRIGPPAPKRRRMATGRRDVKHRLIGASRFRLWEGPWVGSSILLQQNGGQDERRYDRRRLALRGLLRLQIPDDRDRGPRRALVPWFSTYGVISTKTSSLNVGRIALIAVSRVAIVPGTRR